MNGYVCTKPCTLCGVAYSVGDTVPFDAVLPLRERALIKQGYISPTASDSGAAVEAANIVELQAKITELETLLEEDDNSSKNDEIHSTIVIPITTKDGVLELEMNPDDIVMAVSIMQLNVDEAVQTIAGVEKEETLILIDTLETRKTVKAAVFDRSEHLKANENDNQEDESQGDA